MQRQRFGDSLAVTKEVRIYDKVLLETGSCCCSCSDTEAQQMAHEKAPRVHSCRKLRVAGTPV